MNAAKRQYMEEQRLEEETPIQSFSDTAPITQASHRISGGRNFRFAPATELPTFQFAAYPVLQSSHHSLNTISSYLDWVSLEDGSHWKIDHSDSLKVQTWRIGDVLSITPSHCWLCPYTYYITNKSLENRDRGNSWVKANIWLGPLAFGPNTHWVVAVDRISGHLFLENGTNWCVAPSDSYIFDDWAVNDTIIIGNNDSFFTSYANILINVNMNSYVRSRQF